MTTLLNLTLGAAQSNQVGAVYQFRSQGGGSLLRSLVLQGKLVTPAGGTSIDGYVQSSLDGGASWFDIANFHFLTTATAALFNLSTLTAVATQKTGLTDGSLTANTALDGLLGDHFRVKWTSVGTYTGGVFTVDARAHGGSLFAASATG